MEFNLSICSGRPASRQLPYGVYAPILTFFDPETEDLDITTLKKHAVYLIKSGLKGIVTMGSEGEAFHCTREEKLAVTKAVRDAPAEAGFEWTPLILGATEGSVRSTVELCKLAKQAGADFALVLPPSYYKAQMDQETIRGYFRSIADQSPLPIIIYNYPDAVSGIDLDSDTLIKLAVHPNIVGMKLTCGNTGKLIRITYAVHELYPCIEPHFMTFGGMGDSIMQTNVSGGSGTIAGVANLMPRLCIDLCERIDENEKGQLGSAENLQGVVSKADWALTKTSVAGIKSALQTYHGYGGYPRAPLKRLGHDAAAALAEAIREAMELELEAKEMVEENERILAQYPNT